MKPMISFSNPQSYKVESWPVYKIQVKCGVLYKKEWIMKKLTENIGVGLAEAENHETQNFQKANKT